MIRSRPCTKADDAPATIRSVKGHECYHCKQWIAEGVEHDCWTTTEHVLTKDLSEDLRDAYDRLRETAVNFGEQRVYASHHSIMFARKACYFFVRPQRKRLEVVFWLGREVVAPEIRKVVKSSKVKHAHLLHLVHRDQVEKPLTDWLREAYGLQDSLPGGKGGKDLKKVKEAKARTGVRTVKAAKGAKKAGKLKKRSVRSRVRR